LNWFLGGWTALVFVFLYVPIAVLVVYSFNASRLNIVWAGFHVRMVPAPLPPHPAAARGPEPPGHRGPRDGFALTLNSAKLPAEAAAGQRPRTGS